MAVTRNVWGFMERRDHRLMRRVHRWRAPRWIRIWMIVATRLGDGWLWYGLGLAMLLFGGEERFQAFAASGTAALASILLFHELKRVSKRRRPCHIERHCWATLTPPDQFSFPSGHSMTAYAIAIAAGHFYPWALGALLFVAASIAISRIMLGMHFLTDVMVGALLGTGLGYIALVLFAWLAYHHVG